VAKGRERLAVNKQRLHRFHTETFSIKKLKEVEAKMKYHVEVSNRFGALGNLDNKVEINSAWEMIKENIKISLIETPCCYELNKNKPWFEKACSKLLHQRKEAKLQWLQDPSEINGDNLNNVSCEASTHVWNREMQYL
jgi:hypothetical protein